MGYTTKFEGRIKIEPDPPARLISRVNKWCDEPPLTEKPSYIYTRYCDWRVTCDDGGCYLEWNGAEKSYDMDKWLPIIISKFFPLPNFRLNGTVNATGEDFLDIWSMSVEDSKVRRVDGIHMGEETWGNGNILLSRTRDGKGIIAVPDGPGHIEDVASSGNTVTLKFVRGPRR